MLLTYHVLAAGYCVSLNFWVVLFLCCIVRIFRFSLSIVSLNLDLFFLLDLKMLINLLIVINGDQALMSSSTNATFRFICI